MESLDKAIGYFRHLYNVHLAAYKPDCTGLMASHTRTLFTICNCLAVDVSSLRLAVQVCKEINDLSSNGHYERTVSSIQFNLFYCQPNERVQHSNKQCVKIARHVHIISYISLLMLNTGVKKKNLRGADNQLFF